MRRGLLVFIAMVALVLTQALAGCGETEAPAPPPTDTPDAGATLAAIVHATLTALAPTPTQTPLPPTPVPTPTGPTTFLPTPAWGQRVFYTCDGGGRWMFERWAFDGGYICDLGAGRIQFANGRLLTGCVYQGTSDVPK
ncbi:MAG: hypothetical protein U0768_07465 [Anaerolineae bacterium]